ncbi:hypothetical protein E2C01_073726 [Portunus trituberculatus]|uniref:Uncharacterized protein n=1 Tax=Portunus trituberculatus TaxID=210409 RepID=A0A5B7I1H0_PORTR|nr:hypothetical protein [Portunus trituberculatus]
MWNVREEIHQEELRLQTALPTRQTTVAMLPVHYTTKSINFATITKGEIDASVGHVALLRKKGWV